MPMQSHNLNFRVNIAFEHSNYNYLQKFGKPIVRHWWQTSKVTTGSQPLLAQPALAMLS